MTINEARTVSAETSKPLDEPGIPAAPYVETPLVPGASIAGRALVAVIAIMTFLAALTIGAVVLVDAAASEWQSAVAREVTIQIRPMAGRDAERDVAAAASVASEISWVESVKPYSREESAAL